MLERLNGKNVNFLIGSGASVPIYQTLYLNDNLHSFENILSNANDDNEKLLFLYYYKNWIAEMINFEELLDPTILPSDSVERNEVVIMNYERFITNLLNFLYREGSERHKRVNIFTTNYDLLFERTFDNLDDEYMANFNDGSNGFINKTINISNFYKNIIYSGYNDNYDREIPSINLFKMHGSLTWFKENKDKIFVDYNLQHFTKLNEFIEDNLSEFKIEQFHSEIIHNDDVNNNNIYHLLDDYIVNHGINQNNLSKFYNYYTSLPIINPTKFKFHETVFDQHYYQQLRSFSYELEKKDSILIIFGFSFADEHILDIFEISLSNPNLEVFMINFDKKSQEQMKNTFVKYNNIHYLPSFEDFLPDGNQLNGNFEYLNSLLEGKIKNGY